ncbi:hypothetical protein, partial [Acinetobacter sp. YH16058]|uniref:hypothetical protein n=1 Tax=Acinetobacter sp. YH16058 TaxID=2601196 RepID=UPI0015D18265
EDTYLDLRVRENIEKMEEEYYSIDVDYKEKSYDVFYNNNKDVLDLLDNSKRDIIKNMIVEKDYISVYYDLKEKGLINQDELELFLGFTKDFDSSFNKEEVILKYKNKFYEKGLYNKYEPFFEGFNSLYSMYDTKYINNNDSPYTLMWRKRTKEFLTSCGGASVGLGIAFASLAATGVGAPVALAAAGFIFASAAWGAAC